MAATLVSLASISTVFRWLSVALRQRSITEQMASRSMLAPASERVLPVLRCSAAWPPGLVELMRHGKAMPEPNAITSRAPNDGMNERILAVASAVAERMKA